MLPSVEHWSNWRDTDLSSDPRVSVMILIMSHMWSGNYLAVLMIAHVGFVSSISSMLI